MTGSVMGVDYGFGADSTAIIVVKVSSTSNGTRHFEGQVVQSNYAENDVAKQLREAVAEAVRAAAQVLPPRWSKFEALPAPVERVDAPPRHVLRRGYRCSKALRRVRRQRRRLALVEEASRSWP